MSLTFVYLKMKYWALLNDCFYISIHSNLPLYTHYMIWWGYEGGQRLVQRHNATLQAPPIAAARYERRLLAVACKRLLGPS